MVWLLRLTHEETEWAKIATMHSAPHHSNRYNNFISLRASFPWHFYHGHKLSKYVYHHHPLRHLIRNECEWQIFLFRSLQKINKIPCAYQSWYFKLQNKQANEKAKLIWLFFTVVNVVKCIRNHNRLCHFQFTKFHCFTRFRGICECVCASLLFRHFLWHIFQFRSTHDIILPEYDILISCKSIQKPPDWYFACPTIINTFAYTYT